MKDLQLDPTNHASTQHHDTLLACEARKPVPIGRAHAPKAAEAVSTHTFAGASDASVRSLLRYAGRDGVSTDSLAARFGDAAPRVLEELIARGFVAPTPQCDRYAHTLRGREWMELPSERQHRLPSAQRAVLALLDKVRIVSSRSDALFRPHRVVLFGEILAMPPTLRTVDVGIDLVDARDAMERATRGALEENQLDGRKTTPVEWLAARRRGVWAYLSGRSPLLRLLPLVGDSWPDGVEVFPANDGARLLGQPDSKHRFR